MKSIWCWSIRKNRKGTGVYNDWRTAKNDESGVGKAEQEKSILARAIFSTISSIDNTSMRISAEFMKMTKSKKSHSMRQKVQVKT